MQDHANVLTYRFDFLKFRYAFFITSLAMLAFGVFFYYTQHGFVYHIDFTGGAEMRISFEKPLDIAELRAIITEGGWKDAAIQSLGRENRSFLIRVGTTDNELEKAVTSSLKKALPENRAFVDNVELIGPEVGKDTKWNAFKGVFLSLIILALYIAFRSQYRYGMGAIAALAHDILMVLLFLLVTSEPISVHILASVLAVLGYSLNDTIVIFSKIRENMKKYHGRATEYDIINLSINQTLIRTTLTSVATLLSILSLLFLGGETLRGLSLVMCVGIVVGTYSSIYIASAGMLALGSTDSAK